MLLGRSAVLGLVAALSCAVSCTKPNPLDCSDGTCSDQAHPYCDKDGTVNGEPNTCIAVSCSASNAFVECKGDVAVSCNAAGDGYDLMQCSNGCSAEAHGCNMCTPNASYCTSEGVQSCGSDGAPTTFEACAEGCSTDPQPHCAHLVPRYLPGVCDTPSATALDLTSNATLGTDLDSSCTGGVLAQTGAPDICIVRNHSITIESAATLRATGNRLLALVADDSVSVVGTLDASADGGTPGPGGSVHSSGGGYARLKGGGGAGFKTNGAPGGDSTTDGGTANGGPMQPNPAQLAVMVGGPGNDGAGGGGVLLVACRGEVNVSGTIDLGGGGGPGGYTRVVSGVPIAYGGGGGGAGGVLVAQGWRVSITGSVYANGGGGGAGPTDPGPSDSGHDGSRSTTNGAPGGVGQSPSGSGGVGATKSMPSGVGIHQGGGGGGGLGFLQTYTPDGVVPALSPAEASPDFEANLTVQTQ